MEIIINGNLAVMKKNTSFEYISENSLFTGSDSYTLAITFPLKDCPENIRIFGHVHRKDVEKNKVVFDCEIMDRDFYKAGSITITQITEVEVKTQFLEGRSEQNYDDSFDEIRLNELNLGYPDAAQRNPANVSFNTACWNCYPTVNWVALPWVNNTSGNMQNKVYISESGDYSWAQSTKSITFQPYLVYILDKICEVLGYTGDFNAIRNSRYKYLIICNTLPSTWAPWNFAIALPSWTLTEFFEQLEIMMGGEFAINHKARTVTFEFSHRIAARTADEHIEKIVNRYTVEVTKENKSDYVGSKNLAYADNDNRMWAYKSCQWYIDDHKGEAVVYATLAELLAWAATQRISGYQRLETAHGYMESYTRGYEWNSEAHKLFYARDVDTYFIMWCYKAELLNSNHIESTNETLNWYKYYNRLEPVNQFGKKVVDRKAEETELSIVPAWIDDTDEALGQCLFLECGEVESSFSWTGEPGEVIPTSGGVGYGNAHTGSGSTQGTDQTDYNSGALAQTKTGKAIAKGEKEKSDAYFDCLYVAYWDGYNRHPGKLPRPIVDKIELDADFTVKYTPYSLRINMPQEETDEYGFSMKYTHEIDNSKKYTFSFFADVIPDPRALFFIEGGKYVCEKITATFHENTGKSQLLKGVFYRVMEPTSDP